MSSDVNWLVLVLVRCVAPEGHPEADGAREPGHEADEARAQRDDRGAQGGRRHDAVRPPPGLRGTLLELYCTIRTRTLRTGAVPYASSGVRYTVHVLYTHLSSPHITVHRNLLLQSSITASDIEIQIHY